jgi:hypothetical protein
MDADQSAYFLCLPEDLIEQTVGDAEIVDHEHLKTGNAVLDGFLKAVDQITGQILYAGVKGIVNGRLGGADRIAALDCIDEVFTEILQYEIKYCRRSSTCGSSCTRLIVIGRNGSTEGHRQVRVTVDGSRQNEFASGIDDFHVFAL